MASLIAQCYYAELYVHDGLGCNVCDIPVSGVVQQLTPQQGVGGSQRLCQALLRGEWLLQACQRYHAAQPYEFVANWGPMHAWTCCRCLMRKPTSPKQRCEQPCLPCSLHSDCSILGCSGAMYKCSQHILQLGMLSGVTNPDW